MSDTEPQQPRELLFRLVDIGGIREADIRLVAGRLNRLQGQNGIGKTSAILAMLRALGDEGIDLEIRDGADLGTIDVERIGGDPIEDEEERHSRVVVPAKGRIRSQGEPPLSPADVRALTTLITGDHDKGAQPRADKRMKAFLAIVRPKLDEQAAALLCERDAEMMAWLGEKAASGRAGDLLTAAKILKEELQRRAREKEEAAASWEGQAKVHLSAAADLLGRLNGLGAAEGLPYPSLVEAQKHVEAKTLALLQMEQAFTLRREQEKMQASIRAASTERPDVEGAEAAARAFAAAYQEARSEVGQIEQEIAVLQERLGAAAIQRDRSLADGKEAERTWKRLQADAAAWDEQQALLRSEITGPLEGDVAAARVELDAARKEEEVHRLSIDLLEARAEGEAAARKQAQEADRGRQLRTWSKSVNQRVGDVLAKQGAGGFTAVDGRLAYTVDGQPLDFDTRLSTGQQIAAAFALAAAHFHGLVYIAPEFYLSLDQAHKEWVDDFAASRPDLFVVTEEPTSGALSVAHGLEAVAGVAATDSGDEEPDITDQQEHEDFEGREGE